MNEDSNWLYHDHLDLEDQLDSCGAAAKRQDWPAVERLFGQLVQRLKGHMRIEEEVLFPLYEQVPGTPGEPTESLRNDHDSMVNWCRDLHYNCQAQNAAGFISALQPLRDLLAQHDVKEERFFLPMASHTLAGRRQEVLSRLKALDLKDGAGAKRVWGF